MWSAASFQPSCPRRMSARSRCRKTTDTLNATITMESTGLACQVHRDRDEFECRYERHLLRSEQPRRTCANGVPRELKFVGFECNRVVERQSDCRQSDEHIQRFHDGRGSGRCRLAGGRTRIQRHTPVSASISSSPLLWEFAHDCVQVCVAGALSRAADGDRSPRPSKGAPPRPRRSTTAT